MNRPGSLSSKSARAALLGLAALTALIFLFSCAPKEVKPTVEAEDLLSRLKQRRGLIQSFAGRGAFNYKGSSANYRLDFMAVVSAPDRMRIQTFDLMGRPVMTMTADRETLSVLDYQESRMHVGPAVPENFALFIPFGFQINEILDFLSGSPPLPEYQRVELETVKLEGETTWRISLFMPLQDLQENIWLTPEGLLVKQVELGPPGRKPYYRIRFSIFETEPDPNGLRLPRRVHLEDFERDSDLKIDYEEIRINPDLPETLFTLEPPDGVEVVPLVAPEPGDN